MTNEHLIAEALRQENERLKAENETLNYQWHKRSEIGDEWYKLAEKYKVALQEIKEIAEEDCEFCDDVGGCMGNKCRKVRILDLITKAEEE